MFENFSWKRFLLQTISYVLVASLASAATFAFCTNGMQRPNSKLEELKAVLLSRFVNEADETVIEDAGAEAMVAALGDMWSYYIPASEYGDYLEYMNNAYVGIGVTISMREDGVGFDVLQVEPGGSAKDAGILVGDIITEVEGQSVADLGMDGARELIRGQEGTEVRLTIQRNGQSQTLTLVRKTIQLDVTEGWLLENEIGLVRIKNFDSRCAQETKTVISQLTAQGAKALIFDVRNNTGGYKRELVDLLDYLLPKGPIFRGLSNDGTKFVNESDANCLEMPMAVLINGQSYSAAEFFAAALEEYDWAITVGEPTVGKSYYQNTFELSDGSAVNVSIGKYLTPNGVSLAEVGGLVPEIQVPVDTETAAKIYSEQLLPEEDPQIQAAIEVLLSQMQPAA